MTLIVLSGKGLETKPLCRCIPEANLAPGRPLAVPQKISEKYDEFENLLRSAVRLRIAQERAARSKTEEGKGNRKSQ